MKKRLISLIVAVVMLFSMLCPAAYADDETVSFDTCTHEWETPLRSGYSITIPGSDVSFSVKTEQCKKCKWYKHVATIFIAEFTYYSPLNVDANGLVPTELATYWANVWYNNFGKNATATKFTPCGGSTSGDGVGRPKGYADDNGTPNYNSNGFLYYYAPVTGWSYLWGDSTFSVSQALYIGNLGYSIVSGANSSGKNLGNPSSGGTPYARAVCEFTVPVTGNYYVTANHVVGKYYYGDPYVVTYAKSIEMVKALQKGGKAIFFVSCSGNARQQYIAYGYGIEMYIDPVDSTVNKQTTITINNNTWNGNIYTDNSTNLTYIYPPVHHRQREKRNRNQHFQYAHYLQQRNQAILHLRPDHEKLLLHNL